MSEKLFTVSLITHSKIQSNKATFLQYALSVLLIVPLMASSVFANEITQKAMQHGHIFKDCPNCPSMIIIKSGSFMMGSPMSEVGRDEDEGPQHEVSIKKFAVGRFEVSFADWDLCVKEKGCRHKPADASWGRSKRPVINISWNDAKNYVKWLSKKTGHTYRLLSEAEWEYIARAGTATPFAFGDTISTNNANYDGNIIYSNGRQGTFLQKTALVDSYQPNPWGVYNLHGNVLEWVEDCWHKNYEKAPEDGSAWLRTQRGQCNLRVTRGGSWLYSPQSLRSANRTGFSKSYRFPVLGFRVARMLEPSKR